MRFFLAFHLRRVALSLRPDSCFLLDPVEASTPSHGMLVQRRKETTRIFEEFFRPKTSVCISKSLFGNHKLFASTPVFSGLNSRSWKHAIMGSVYQTWKLIKINKNKTQMREIGRSRWNALSSSHESSWWREIMRQSSPKTRHAEGKKPKRNDVNKTTKSCNASRSFFSQFNRDNKISNKMFDNKRSESCIPALNSQSCSMTGKAGQVESGDDDYEAAAESQEWRWEMQYAANCTRSSLMCSEYNAYMRRLARKKNTLKSNTALMRRTIDGGALGMMAVKWRQTTRKQEQDWAKEIKQLP